MAEALLWNPECEGRYLVQASDPGQERTGDYRHRSSRCSPRLACDRSMPGNAPWDHTNARRCACLTPQASQDALMRDAQEDGFDPAPGAGTPAPQQRRLTQAESAVQLHLRSSVDEFLGQHSAWGPRHGADSRWRPSSTGRSREAERFWRKPVTPRRRRPRYAGSRSSGARQLGYCGMLMRASRRRYGPGKHECRALLDRTRQSGRCRAARRRRRANERCRPTCRRAAWRFRCCWASRSWRRCWRCCCGSACKEFPFLRGAASH